MNLEQLSAFVAAAETGSFSAAARLVSKTPAAISQLIANLEIDFNIRLFDRSGRYPALTDEGVTLYDYAKRIVDLSNDMERKVASLHKQVEDQVTIGVEGCISHFVMPELLGRFAKNFPDVRLNVVNMDSKLLRQSVINGTLDLGIGFWDFKDNVDYYSYTLKSVATTVVISPQHPLAGEEVAYDDLCSQRQLLLPVNKSFDSAIISVNRWEFDSVSDLISGVIKGLGWAALPMICVENQLKSGELVELEEIDFGISTEAIYLELMSSKLVPAGPAISWLKQTISELEIENNAD
ncbi:LysR family transcriptional regulator [Photobacterium sanguinicancri]|uniref:LysR family transcriptional regulator n=1 Tax=Photobacterium sanguinicancri TaxID=875932 RepID=UPI0026E36CCE|nr:LysR family transcriptional regulator [Photobacterium sanguinicancri]MDO6498490.1 LysR family transcriptional regulator [Photobacterium sanguinicancri]